MTDLLDRILQADPTMRVDDVVRGLILEQLPPTVERRFSDLQLVWRDDREVWGLSFDLRTEDRVQLGHFRGHHIGQHPKLIGFSRAAAERIVAREVEGVLLHELGHALWTACGVHNLRGLWRVALLAEGWPSTYAKDAHDVAEGAAEAFRWWAMDPAAWEARAPRQAALIAAELDGAERRLEKA